MEIASYERGIEWLAEKGYPRSITGNWDDVIPWVGFTIDPDSGKKTALARMMTERVLQNDEVLMIANETGIWPSCEHEHLFIEYRARAGASRGLDYPTHIFTPADINYQIGLLALSLYFIWGALLADSTGLVVQTSHDEWMQVGCGDPFRLASAVDALTSFGMKQFAPRVVTVPHED